MVNFWWTFSHTSAHSGITLLFSLHHQHLRVSSASRSQTWCWNLGKLDRHLKRRQESTEHFVGDSHQSKYRCEDDDPDCDNELDEQSYGALASSKAASLNGPDSLANVCIRFALTGLTCIEKRGTQLFVKPNEFPRIVIIRSNSVWSELPPQGRGDSSFPGHFQTFIARKRPFTAIEYKMSISKTGTQNRCMESQWYKTCPARVMKL